jgi:hypothetical protein
MILVSGAIHPDHAHLVDGAVAGSGVHAQVHFGGGGDGANVPQEHRTFTVMVHGLEDLQALHSALSQIGGKAWVPEATEQGMQAAPLEDYLSRIQW